MKSFIACKQVKTVENHTDQSHVLRPQEWAENFNVMPMMDGLQFVSFFIKIKELSDKISLLLGFVKQKEINRV